MELGKIQKAWVKSLREHPERQMKGKLGEGTPRNYKACCLGELLCVVSRINKSKLPFSQNGKINDQNYSEKVLHMSYEKLGLFGDSGKLTESVRVGVAEENSLALLNDRGATWTEIADFIEANPEKVFTKFV